MNSDDWQLGWVKSAFWSSNRFAISFGDEKIAVRHRWHERTTWQVLDSESSFDHQSRTVKLADGSELVLPRSDYVAHGKPQEPNLSIDEGLEYSFENSQNVSLVTRVENDSSESILKMGKEFWGIRSLLSSKREFQFRNFRDLTEKTIAIAFLADSIIDYSS